MTQAFDVQSPRSPLAAIHQRLDATIVSRDGWSVPANYGDILFEYAAVRERGAGLSDLSSRGRIIVSGSEAVQFLNGLITNDMKTLAVNSWMPAAFPNVQGRLIASVRVVRLKDEGTGKNVTPTFLLDTETATHERVLQTIERFTLAGDFRVTDVTSQTALLSLQGNDAAAVIRSVIGNDAADVGANQVVIQSWRAAELTIMRASHTGADGFDVVVDSPQAGVVWDALQGAGARPVGFDALELLRIEAGVPRYAVDMDDTNVVPETNLDDAVSYTKGCYVGQEIIARIKYRGHVAKKLTGLIFAEPAQVAAGALIKASDAKEVGRITSVTYSPHLGRTIALGYLKYDYLQPGTNVLVGGDAAEIPAQAAALPFVGSVR
jgi:folate-binding protein YgfZ